MTAGLMAVTEGASPLLFNQQLGQKNLVFQNANGLLCAQNRGNHDRALTHKGGKS